MAGQPTAAMLSASEPILAHAGPEFASTMPCSIGVGLVSEAIANAYMTFPVFVSPNAIRVRGDLFWCVAVSQHWYAALDPGEEFYIIVSVVANTHENRLLSTEV